MNKRVKHFVAIVIAAAGVLSTSSIAKAEDVTGGGASFPVSFLTPAIAEFNKTFGHNLTYTSTGSGTGKKNFKASTFKFAGTDSAVGSSDLPSFGWTYVPYVAGAIAIGYRLDELKGTTLSLSPATINGIFGGVISKWNDPSIANDIKMNPTWGNSKKKSDVKGATALWENVSTTSAKITVSMLPAALKASKGKKIEWIDDTTKKVLKTLTVGPKAEVNMTGTVKSKDKYSVKVGGKTIATYSQIEVKLPDTAIQVVYRADTSGTTNNFCQYMAGASNPDWKINDAFQSCVPGGVTAYGSRFVGQPQSNNQANYIASTNGAIGYGEVSYYTDPTRAAQGVRAANILNAAGKFVAPTSAGYNSHLAGGTQDEKGLITFNWKQTANPTAYPLGATTYALCQTANDAKNKVIAQFFQWIITDFAPKNAEALAYTPLLGATATNSVALAKKCGAS
ncbi:MAG: substrate-binding domain-containing protein [Ilumatobacteraceae bacterium]|nr:substrate-binding domain-containing protein [Ilumatobacteraceae bacterium]